MKMQLSPLEQNATFDIGRSSLFFVPIKASVFCATHLIRYSSVGLGAVIRSEGFQPQQAFGWDKFWVGTNLVISVHRKSSCYCGKNRDVAKKMIIQASRMSILSPMNHFSQNPDELFGIKQEKRYMFGL